MTSPTYSFICGLGLVTAFSRLSLAIGTYSCGLAILLRFALTSCHSKRHSKFASTMKQITVTFTTTSSTSSPTIPINLQVHAEARCLDEMWSGRTSPSTRRILQNRLNQRSFRRRKAAEKAERVQIFDLDPAPALAPSGATTILQDHPTQAKQELVSSLLASPPPQSNLPQFPHPQQPDLGLDLPILTASWCRQFESFLSTQQIADVPEYTSTNQERSTTVSFEELFLKYLKQTDLYRLPADDSLLSLMYYNVFRALVTNVWLLGLDTQLMHTDDYPSPFISGSASTQHIPPHLQPTLLQRTVPHHPCFDIFPDPVVRDQGIRNTHLLPHGTLCMTLAGRNTWFENERSRRSGLVVWGPPEDSNSWEVTEGFVTNWGWLVKGSLMLQYSTNRWRAVRGEPAIFFA
jgi:Domain of unknown function (DUF3425)